MMKPPGHSWALMLGLFAASIIGALAQSPTHIDQGTNDPSVDITDDTIYVVIVVAFLVLLAAYFLILRKRMTSKDRRGKDNK